MVASIGKIASLSQDAGYFEKDGYYTRDDGAHREASAWAGRSAEALGLAGPVDPERFRSVLEGEVPGDRRLGRREIDGGIVHRSGRDVTLSAPKSVSLMAKVGGDGRIVEARDKAVAATLGWIEKNAVETRMRDPATTAMVRAGDQKMVAATFRHDTSRSLAPSFTRMPSSFSRRLPAYNFCRFGKIHPFLDGNGHVRWLTVARFGKGGRVVVACNDDKLAVGADTELLREVSVRAREVVGPSARSSSRR